MDICDWLRELLKDGPKEVNEVRRAARAAGYTRGELREARFICQIETKNNHSVGHPVTDCWYWSLPEDTDERIRN